LWKESEEMNSFWIGYLAGYITGVVMLCIVLVVGMRYMDSKYEEQFMKQ
jgi:hypothetical protein